MVLQIIVMGFLVEALVDTVSLVYENGIINRNKVMALLVGIAVAFSAQLDVFAVLGMQSAVPYIGVVFAGILISRGGNFVHDFMKKLKGGEENTFTLD